MQPGVQSEEESEPGRQHLLSVGCHYQLGMPCLCTQRQFRAAGGSSDPPAVAMAKKLCRKPLTTLGSLELNETTALAL
jgi:hypothetical protein